MISQPGFTVSLKAVLAVGMESKSGSPRRVGQRCEDEGMITETYEKGVP